MSSLASWLHKVISGTHLFVLRKLGNLDEIEEHVRRTDSRYLDARSLSVFSGVSLKEAEQYLQEAVQRGELLSRFLVTLDNLPMIFVRLEELGTTISSADLNLIDGPDEEIYLNPNDSKEVFIVPEEAQTI